MGRQSAWKCGRIGCKGSLVTIETRHVMRGIRRRRRCNRCSFIETTTEVAHRGTNHRLLTNAAIELEGQT